MEDVAIGSVGKAYGQALFELAVEAHCVDRVADDLKGLVNVISEDQDVSMFVNTPHLPADVRTSILEKVFADKVCELSHNFLGTVMKKGQIRQLIDIQKEYSRLVDEHKGIVFVEVTVDREPGEKGREILVEKLCKASGKQVKMKVNIKPEILGGMIIRQGDILIDNSIVKALEGAVERIKGIR